MTPWPHWVPVTSISKTEERNAMSGRHVPTYCFAHRPMSGFWRDRAVDASLFFQGRP